MRVEPPRSPEDQLIRTRRGPLVMLFYDGFERLAEPGVLGALHSEARRTARYLWRSLRRKQVWTGFYTAFLSLQRSLEREGCDVRVNAFRLAARHPRYPIGLAGFPSVLGKVALPNPRIFGPGDYGYPDEAARVASDPRMRVLIQPSDWAVEYYRPWCGDKLLAWPVGIDTEAWPDASREPKDLDVLVYDKLRWHREQEVPRVLDRALRHIEARGLSHAVLRYGAHHRGQFVHAVRRARAMLFLCEHETQGLAYQEALASNLPVLAWDEGRLVDPLQRRFAQDGLRVTSVPYFDERCGMRFRLDGFEAAFDTFWKRLPEFRPRDYVQEHLSMRASARAYLAAYAALSEGREAVSTTGRY
jgi:hypothetical protein